MQVAREVLLRVEQAPGGVLASAAAAGTAPRRSARAGPRGEGRCRSQGGGAGEEGAAGQVRSKEGRVSSRSSLIGASGIGA